MTRKRGWWVGGLALLGLLAVATAAQAAGLEDFKLIRAIPADAMMVVDGRDHAGLAFLKEQKARIWAAFEQQHLERDLKKLFKEIASGEGGDPEEFEQWWQKLADLMALVEWSKLAEREAAFAMKLSPPIGADFVVLLMPPQDKIESSFTGMSALLKALTEIAGEGTLVLTTEGEGARTVHKLAPADMPVPMSLTLARHDDVILVGFGTSMPEQSLALLRGETDPKSGSVVATPRFKSAFEKLPAATDSVMFVDTGQLIQQLRAFAQLIPVSASLPADDETPGPPDELVALVDAVVNTIDLWDYAAAVAATEGMKTVAEQITVLKSDAKAKPLGKVLYGGSPVRDPLKYVPVEATSVSAMGGLDIQALYPGVIEFIRKEVPDGEQMLAQWEEMRQTLPLDIEKDILAWLGGEFIMFSAPLPTPFQPSWVFVMRVKDAEKATATLEKVTQMAVEALAAQQQAEAGVTIEDAQIEGADGFKKIIPPPGIGLFVPGLGTPTYGLKDGLFFISNNPDVLKLSLDVAAGSHDSFAKNERFKSEGLPVPGNLVRFGFQDLTNWGKELGDALAMVGMLPMVQPELAKNPGVMTAVSLVTKLGKVLKEVNFLRSTCSVGTLEGNVVHTKTVTNYQTPPAPPGKPVPTAAQTEAQATP